MILHRFLIILFLSLLISWICCCQKKIIEPTGKVSAAQIFIDYDRNASAADSFYIGKTFILSGKVSHYAELHGEVGIYLKSEGLKSDWIMLCVIDKKDASDIYSRLREEKELTFIGTINRKSDGSFINLTNCRFAD